MTTLFPQQALPPAAGLSQHPPGTLFISCPGNGQPWGGMHPRPVFLPKYDCRPKAGAKKHRPEQRYTPKCNLCGCMVFFYSQAWAVGVTREQIVAQFGPGVAVDEGGYLL